jgi:hypothetical protein
MLRRCYVSHTHTQLHAIHAQIHILTLMHTHTHSHALTYIHILALVLTHPCILTHIQSHFHTLTSALTHVIDVLIHGRTENRTRDIFQQEALLHHFALKL